MISGRHRLLCILAFAAVLAFAIVQLFFLRPLRAEAAALRARAASSQSELTAKGWPLDLDKLRVATGETANRRDRASRRKDQVIAAAGTTFDARVIRQFETKEHFESQVTRLDYQQEFNRVERKLRDLGINVDREVFKISEDTGGIDIYQLVLQVWTVEAVVDRALAQGLRMAPAAGDGDAAAAGATISVLLPEPYVVAAEDPQAYMIRLPVRLRVVGDLAQMQAFLRAAPAAGSFVCVERMELGKSAVAAAAGGDDVIEAEFVCSTFYLLRSDEGRSILKPEKPAAVPRGA